MPADPRQVLKGRVLDPDGKPVVGATIGPRMAYYPDGTGTSACTGVDPMAITNARGEFTLLSEKPLKCLDLFVEARALARRCLLKVPPGEKPLDIVLQRGVTVQGRLLKDGRPVPNVALGLVQADRSSDKFLGDYTIGTDTDGRFAFINIAPQFDYYIYGKIDSLKSLGALPVHKVTVGPTDTTTDAGTLTLAPAHRLRGQVVLADGAKIPPDTRLMLSREFAWDSTFATLDEAGHFDLTGVPAEPVSLIVLIKGYRYSAKNPSLDALNPTSLTGRVDQDLAPLIILLEPGERQPPDWKAQRPTDRPLRGVTSAPASQP